MLRLIWIKPTFSHCGGLVHALMTWIPSLSPHHILLVLSLLTNLHTRISSIFRFSYILGMLLSLCRPVAFLKVSCVFLLLHLVFDYSIHPAPFCLVTISLYPFVDTCLLPKVTLLMSIGCCLEKLRYHLGAWMKLHLKAQNLPTCQIACRRKKGQLDKISCL